MLDIVKHAGIVGEKRNSDFYFVGSIKNGFVPSTRQKVFDAIKGKEMVKSPFVNLPEKKSAHRMDREEMATVRWLRPRIVAEIAFNERTQAGQLRHSKFLRLRDRADQRTKARTNPKLSYRSIRSPLFSCVSPASRITHHAIARRISALEISQRVAIAGIFSLV